MKIIIAPQAYKNCASAQDVAEAISRGIAKAYPEAKRIVIPIADGGDSTLNILLAACQGKRLEAIAAGPLGENRSVPWGIIKINEQDVAVIETALICGLTTLAEKQRNPSTTTTYGVGAVIRAALDRGCRTLFIGLGGSATNDGGVGMAQALGVRLMDKHGCDLPRGGTSLPLLEAIDISGLDRRLASTNMIVGCDVMNPLLGDHGASRTFASQKGASPEMVDKLEEGMEHYVRIVKRELGVDLAQMPYGGAAGGLAAGLHLFCRGKLVSGAEWILQQIGFYRELEGADLVIVGEGKIDRQTAALKGPFVAARAAQARDIPVIAIVGTVGEGAEALGLEAIIPTTPPGTAIPTDPLPLIEAAAFKIYY